VARGAKYATTGDGLNIAYVTEGAGDPLVWIAHHFTSHVELEWEFPQSYIYRTLARRCMVVRFDTRGVGLSDRDQVSDVSLDARLRDFEAVVGRLGLEHFALAGLQGGGNLAAAYAAQHPERVPRLVLVNWTPNFSVDSERSRMSSLRDLLVRDWELFTENMGRVSFGYDSPYAEGYGRLVRASVTQEMAMRYGSELLAEDCTPLLPAIEAETLILHSEKSAYASQGLARRTSAAIRNSRLREFEGELTEHIDRIVTAIAEFLELPEEPPSEVEAQPPANVAQAPAHPGALLSTRELEVLLLVVKGRSNREIAAELVLSPRTVERHLENLYRKTGTHNRAEAAAYAVANGLA
jgi:pimeloyl-ACP methyl ester carboxylesterase/DNA-binding CsgD family transcriptional regulator